MAKWRRSHVCFEMRILERDWVRLREVVSQIFVNPRKLTAYPLDLENPKGQAKAMMFSPANYQSLLAQIEAKAWSVDVYSQSWR